VIADVRKLTITDLPEMLRVYNSQDNILKIKKTTHIDIYYYRVLKVFASNDHTLVAFGSFDGDRLIAFSTCNIWTNLPYWTIGLFYIDAEYVSAIHSIDIAGALKSAITQYAESKKLYTGYSISTINALNIRSWQQTNLKDSNIITPLWEDNEIRYNITVEEIILPFGHSKNRTFGQMLGITEGFNTVPLIVTRWTLVNKFRTLSVSEKHMKRLNKLANA